VVAAGLVELYRNGMTLGRLRRLVINLLTLCHGLNALTGRCVTTHGVRRLCCL